MTPDPEPKHYKYGTCPVCGRGLARDGKCFLFPMHSQKEADDVQSAIDAKHQAKVKVGDVE